MHIIASPLLSRCCPTATPCTEFYRLTIKICGLCFSGKSGHAINWTNTRLILRITGGFHFSFPSSIEKPITDSRTSYKFHIHFFETPHSLGRSSGCKSLSEFIWLSCASVAECCQTPPRHFVLVRLSLFLVASNDIGVRWHVFSQRSCKFLVLGSIGTAQRAVRPPVGKAIQL